MAQTEMDVAAVRAATGHARQVLAGLQPCDQAEQAVKEGGALLRHEAATPSLDTAAERLHELLAELALLAGDVVDALDSAAATVTSVDHVNEGQFRAGVR